jgi:hypothetical protein
MPSASEPAIPRAAVTHLNRPNNGSIDALYVNQRSSYRSEKCWGPGTDCLWAIVVLDTNPIESGVTEIMGTTGRSTTRLQNLRRRAAAVLAATALLGTFGQLAPAEAAAARWVYVGREGYTIYDELTRSVPTYVNVNSIQGSRYDSFTITFQGRFGGRSGINRVNIGVVVDCTTYEAYADQFIVYFDRGSSDYDQTDGGELSERVQAKALSYCR